MAKLPPAVKVFIIERLASFELPSEVAAAVKAEFGLSLVRSTIESCDPTKVSGSRMAKRWADLFHAKRAEYVSDIYRIRRSGPSMPGTRPASPRTDRANAWPAADPWMSWDRDS
jgi:hypothetical protein